MFPVGMLLSKELCLGSQHVVLLLRQEEGQGFFYILSVAYLYLYRLCVYLHLVFAAQFLAQFLSQLGMAVDGAPFGYGMCLSVHRHLGVPHFFDEVVYILVGEADGFHLVIDSLADVTHPVFYLVYALVDERHSVTLHGFHQLRHILYLS